MILGDDMATQALVNNPNFTNEFNESFNSLIMKILDFFKEKYPKPDMEQQRFLETLRTLKIEDNSMINAPLIKRIERANTFQINCSRIIKEEIDPQFLLAVNIVALLNPDEKLKPIVIGNAAAMVAHSIISNEGAPIYENEQIITNLLARVLSDEVILKVCFDNDMDALNKALMEKNITIEYFKDFLEKAKYMHESNMEA